MGSETESRVASVNYLAARAFSPLSRSLTHVRAQLSPPVSRVSSVLRAARLYALISTFTAAKVQVKKATKNTKKRTQSTDNSLLGRGTERKQAARTRRWLRTVAEGGEGSGRRAEGEGSSTLGGLLGRQSRGWLLLLVSVVVGYVR